MEHEPGSNKCLLKSPVALLAAWRGGYEKTGNPCDCRFDVYDGHAVRLW